MALSNYPVLVASLWSFCTFLDVLFVDVLVNLVLITFEFANGPVIFKYLVMISDLFLTSRNDRSQRIFISILGRLSDNHLVLWCFWEGCFGQDGFHLDDCLLIIFGNLINILLLEFWRLLRRLRASNFFWRVIFDTNSYCPWLIIYGFPDALGDGFDCLDFDDLGLSSHLFE